MQPTATEERKDSVNKNYHIIQYLSPQNNVYKIYHIIWYICPKSRYTIKQVIEYLRRVRKDKNHKNLSAKPSNYHHNLPYISYLINYQRLKNAKKTKTTITKTGNSLSLKNVKEGRASF